MMAFETSFSEDIDLPLRIEHGCDIIADEAGELLQYYNFLVYRFGGVGHDLWARTYLDQVHTITLYGSISEADRGRLRPEHFDCEEGKAILRYLQRRYSEVRLSGSPEYVFPDAP